MPPLVILGGVPDPGLGGGEVEGVDRPLGVSESFGNGVVVTSGGGVALIEVGGVCCTGTGPSGCGRAVVVGKVAILRLIMGIALVELLSE
jgi:hypothetical protein